MNKKQILVLSVIFAVLALGLAMRFLMKKQDLTVAKEVYASLSFSFDPEKIERILIALGPQAAPVELVKQNGQWRVKNLWDAVADGEKVKNLLDTVRGAKGELRSADNSVLKDFGITDQAAISLKLMGTGKTPLLDLKIGTQKAGYGGFFVRKSGASEVYFVDAPFDRLFGIFMPDPGTKLAPDFWADLRLLTLDPEKVKKIMILHLKDDAVKEISGVERLAQKDAPPEGGWKLVGPQRPMPVDSGKVLRFIAAMNSIRAKGIADPAGTNYGLEKPVWKLVVTEGDKTVTLEAGPKDEKEGVYFMKVRDVPQVFRLAAEFFEDLDLKDEQFLKETPKAAEASGVAPRKGP